MASAQVTNVSACTTISSPGTYVLNTSIINSAASVCINITASNVIFDGQGYTIDGTGAPYTYGVSVSGQTNVTVKNLVVTDWYYGIYYLTVQNGSIINSTASSNQYGILLFSSSGNTLANNTASSNTQRGIYLWSSSNNNALTNNTASSNTYGIYLQSSSSNNLTGNTVWNNTQDGIYLTGSNNNTLTGNTVTLNALNGIRLISSSSNTIYNNFFNNTNNAGFGGTNSNTWNTSKTSGNNIIGGPNSGGNFWATPTGDGFSETCNDGNDDGICDNPYNLATGNVDHLPLTSIRGIIKCGVIISPGVYRLNQSITDSSATRCIEINSSNVVLDGKGYTLYRTTPGTSTYGVYVSGQTNVTVKNITVTNWITGIGYVNSGNGTIANSNASNNVNYGILLTNSNNITVANNTASSNTQNGIYLTFSGYNTFINNTVSNNGNGIYLTVTSSYNTLTNNTVSNNTLNGISIAQASSYNTLTGNTVSNNNNGITFSGSYYNTLTDNTMKNNQWDFYSEALSSSNTIINNLFTDTIASFTYSGNIKVNSSSSPATDPAGYSSIGKYLKITNLTAAAWVYLNISYTDAEAAGVVENTLRMWKYDGSSWSAVSGSGVNTTENYVYANLTSFSIFAPMGLSTGSGSGGGTQIDTCTTISLPGVYRLAADLSSSSTCINITASNVTFDGQGYTVNGAGSGYGVYVYNSSALTNVTVKNLNVTGWYNGIYYQNVQNGNIENSTAFNNSNGINLYLSSSNTLINNTASNNTYGIYLSSSSSNTLTSNNANYNSNGIHLRFSSNNNKLINNKANNNTQYGIYLYQSRGNTLTNNTAWNNTQYGIYLYAYSNSNTLTSNTASSNGYGISIRFRSNNNNLISNTASDNVYGIYLFQSSGNTLTNNTASNNNNYGIYLYSSSNFNTITDNTANNNTHGIYVRSSSSNNLTDNNASNNNNYGIVLWSSSNSNTLTNNNAWNNTQYGIYLYSSSSNTLVNNTASSNTRGIYLNSASDSNTLTNNTASWNTWDGIRLDSSDGNTISGNNISYNNQGGGYEGLGIYSSDSNLITQNFLTANPEYAIKILNSQNNILDNNTLFANCGGIAQLFIDGANNTVITNNDISSGTGLGMDWRNSSNVTVSGNTFDSNANGGIDAGASGVVSDSRVVNNVIINNPSFGIRIMNSNNVSIDNNTIYSNAGDGLVLYQTNNSVVSNNNVSSNTRYGIYLYLSSNSNLTDNTANSNTWYGIYLTSSSSNTLTNNTANYNARYGIILFSSTSNTLTDNTANSNTQDGIYLYNSTSNTITNNTASTNTLDGIRLDSASSNTLTNNTASSNNYGIFLDSFSDSNTLTDNTLRSNQWDFYSEDGPSSNTIINNLFTSTKASFTYGGGIRVNSSSSPATDPAGYSSIGKYLKITNLTAAAWVYLNISYTDAEAAGVVENTLRMWKYDGSSWSAVSGSGVNTAENYVYANLTSFSVFAPMATPDTTPPTINIVSPANTSISDSTPLLNVTFGERVNFAWYSVDGAANSTPIGSTYNLTLNLPVLADGAHNLTVYANDSVGSLNSSTVYFTVDTVAPSVGIVSPTNTTYSSTSVSLSVSADEAVSAWLYSLNGAANVSFTPNITLTAARGANSIVVYASDSAGNWGSAAMYFTVSLPSSQTGGGGGGGVPPRLVIQTVDVTPEGVADLVGHFFYFGREFYMAPSELAGVLGSLGYVPTSAERVELLNAELHSPVKTMMGRPYPVANLTGEDGGEVDQYAIASEKVLKEYSEADKVIIARGDLGVDSLAAVAYARALKAPILLVKPGELPVATENALLKLNPKETVVLGGPVAVSDEVAALLPNATRIWGADRYGTAVKIASALEEVQSIDTIVVTDGLAPDATSVMLADYYEAPIIYVKGEEVPPATEDYLVQHRTSGVRRILLVGIADEAGEAIRELMKNEDVS